NRQAIVEGERLPGEADARLRLRSVSEGAIPVAPTAHNIEALEREARGIDGAMARGASGIGAVPVELLADSDCAPDIRLQSGHPRGRRGVETKDAFHDPDPT